MKLGVGTRRPAQDGPHIACIIAATAIATTIKQGACRRRAPCSGIAREASAAAFPVLLLLFALPAVGLALSALPCRHLLLALLRARGYALARLLRLAHARLDATRLRRWLRLRWRGDARLRRRNVGCGRRDARLWRRCRRLSCFTLPRHGRGVAIVTAPWLNRRSRRTRHGGRRCRDGRPCNAGGGAAGGVQRVLLGARADHVRRRVAVAPAEVVTLAMAQWGESRLAAARLRLYSPAAVRCRHCVVARRNEAAATPVVRLRLLAVRTLAA